MASTVSAADIVRELIERAWNLAELDVVDVRIASDFVRHTSVGDMVGPEVFKQRIVDMHAGINRFHTRIHELGGDNARAFCRFTVTGRHLGDYLGFAPTGNDIVFEGAVIAHAANGQLVEEWEYFDTASILAQLGSAQS